MPSEPYVWIIIVIAVALVAGLAIWKGGRFKLTGSKKGGIRVEAGGKPDGPGSRISILERGDIRDSDIGQIAGQTGGELPTGGIEVMKRGKIQSGTKIDSIVGYEAERK